MNRWLLILSCLLALPGGNMRAQAASAHEDLPAADAVIRRLIERAESNLTNQHATAVAFFRTNITETYKSNGEVKERIETVKKVVLQDGKRSTELVLYNGRQPTSREVRKEQEKAERRRAGRDEKEAPDRSRQINAYVTEAILSRFVFEVEGREEVDGHPCLLVRFQPAPDQDDSDKIFDKVINQMGGIIWIHETEHEMVKADIQLRERVKMWGGFLAALDRISLKIKRMRRPDGFWIDRQVEARFSGRALTKYIDVMTWDFASQPVFLRNADEEEPAVAAQ